MNILTSAIIAYQRHPSVSRTVRWAVRVHHRLTPHRDRHACQFTGSCSAAALAAGDSFTTIAARMAACGLAIGSHSPPYHSGNEKLCE